MGKESSREEEFLVQKKMLEDFIVNNGELEELESSLGEFNIFESIGAVRQELRHSDFLAFLFNPVEKHGLDDYFLKSYLKDLVSKHDCSLSAIDVDTFNFSDVEVRKEWKNIDLMMMSPSNQFCAVIENKVDTTEHDNQLERYHEIVTNEFSGYKMVFIYLTPDSAKPSHAEYVDSGYRDIYETLQKTLNAKSSVIGDDVSTIIKHYLTMIRRHIMSDSDIAELCRKIYRTHKDALDLIFEHKPDDRQKIADHFITKIEADERFTLERSSKTAIRFSFTSWDDHDFQKTGTWFSSDNGTSLVMFEISQYDTYISFGLYIGPGERTAREAFHKVVYGKFDGKSRKLGKSYYTIFSKRLLCKNDLTISIEEVLTKVDECWLKLLKTIEEKKLIEIIETV